jgi:calmodulin
MITQILKNPAKVKKVTEAAFKAIDFDGGGYIEKEELEKIMAGVAEDNGVERPSKEEVEEIIKTLDSSGQGRLSM